MKKERFLNDNIIEKSEPISTNCKFFSIDLILHNTSQTIPRAHRRPEIRQCYPSESLSEYVCARFWQSSEAEVSINRWFSANESLIGDESCSSSNSYVGNGVATKHGWQVGRQLVE